MKKGFILALLTVAMVALALPAGAVAPVIDPIPDIVIGDAGDISGTGTPALRLLRYVDVLDLGSAVTRPNNPATTSALAVWFTANDTTGTLLASNATALVRPMTTTETSVLVNTGVRPPLAKKINGGGLWMSLIQDSPGAGKTHAANAISATPTSNGANQAELIARGIPGSVITCKLYALDSDVDTTAIGQSNNFKVYSVLNAEDSVSPVGGEPVYSADFEGNADGWTTLTYPLLNFVVANFVKTPTAVGFTGQASLGGKGGAYAQWYSPVAPPTVPAAGSDGKIYRAKMVMSGNSTTQQGTPGYRFLYLNIGFNHVGGYQVYSITDWGPPNNMPSSGTQKTMRMYWEVPRDLAEYNDAGKLNKVIDPTTDLRDYYVIFDIVSFEAGETNSIMMEDFEVVRFVRPPSVTPVLKYGAGASPFGPAGGVSTWQSIAGDFGTGWGEGTAVLTADTIALTRGSATTGGGFKQVAPYSSATNLPAWQSNKLVRYSLKIAASDPMAYPPFRMFLLTYPTGSAVQDDVLWVDAIDPAPVRSNPGYSGTYSRGSNTVLAGSPKATAGSTIRCYAYTHTATAASVLDPSIDVAAAPATFPQNGWLAPNATMTISSYQIEVLTAP